MSYTLYVVTKMFCKRAWLGGVLAVCVLVLGPLSLYEFIYLAEGSVGEDLKPFNYHFAFLGVSWLLFITVCLHALQDSQKVIFGLPVSSVSISSVLMLVTVGIVVLLNLLTNGLYRLTFFDENWLTDYWPLLGPTLFLVTLVMVGHCSFWNLHAIGFGRLLFWVCFVIAMFWWFLLRYHPQGINQPAVPWSHVTLSEFITMQVVCIGAWLGGTRSFSNVRRGTAVPSLQWKRMEVWLNRLSTGSLITEKPLSHSKSRALARLHWRDSCYVTLILAVCLGAGGMVANLFLFSHMASFDFKNQSFNDNPVAVTVMFAFLTGTVVLLVLGQGVSSKNMTEMKRYLATASLSDRDFSAVLMQNLIKCAGLALLLVILVSFLFSNGIAALYYGFDNVKSTWEWYGNQGPQMIYSGSFLFLLGYWACISNSVSVLWTGRKPVCTTVTLALMGFFILSIVVLNFLIPESVQLIAEQAFLVFLTCCILGTTITAYYLAKRKALVSSTTVWIAILFSIIVPLFLWNFWKTDQTALKLFLSSTAILVVTPFATIPLALAWNRHR